MQLDNKDLNELLTLAQDAALAAGKIIRSVDRTKLKVNTKTGGENLASQVVTQIDVDAQNAIIDILSESKERYDLGLLAEESTDDNSRFMKDYFWCIDPLDGTLAFSRNEKGYSVSIALVNKDGMSIIGVVYNPLDDVLYYALHGHGAYKNDGPFKLNPSQNVLTLLYDQSFLKMENYKQEMERLEKLANKHSLKGIRKYHLGGAVMNGITTIELAPAIYYKHPKKSLGGGSIWDFAASSIIQSEAGGHNSSFDGTPLNLNNKQTSFMNQQGVLYLTGIPPKEFYSSNITW